MHGDVQLQSRAPVMWATVPIRQGIDGTLREPVRQPGLRQGASQRVGTCAKRVQQEHGLAPGGVDLVPVHGLRGRAAQAEAR